jgi:hypothetical protein
VAGGPVPPAGRNRSRPLRYSSVMLPRLKLVAPALLDSVAAGGLSNEARTVYPVVPGSASPAAERTGLLKRQRNGDLVARGALRVPYRTMAQRSPYELVFAGPARARALAATRRLTSTG